MAPRRVAVAAGGRRRCCISCSSPRAPSGASVIDRYLLGGATVLLLFCAVVARRLVDARARLERCGGCGSLGAAALGRLRSRLGGDAPSTSRACATRSPTTRNSTPGLAAALRDPAVAAQLRRCALLSLPNNKLIPDARWILDTRRPARHRRPQPGARRRRQGLAHAREPDPARQRRGVPARQRDLLRGDRRRRRRRPRPGAAARLQAHLHEPLLRGLWQLLRCADGRAPRGLCAPAHARAGGIARSAPALGAAPVGDPPGAAVRLQRRRGRPLRAARGADVREQGR